MTQTTPEDSPAIPEATHAPQRRWGQLAVWALFAALMILVGIKLHQVTLGPVSSGGAPDFTLITFNGESYTLSDLFMVMATQNPIEQEGTYPLPEAQLDRFLLHAQVGYPSIEDERRILILNRDEAKAGERDAFAPPKLLAESSIMEARQAILHLHLADELEQYIVNIVVATRDPSVVDDSLKGQVQYGASPRACMGIDRCARAHAWLAGRDYVGPEDIQAMAPDVLRHRLVLTFEAEADGITPDSIIKRVLDGVGVP